eukprot:7411160-Pyramimonas_sp.AAC.1
MPEGADLPGEARLPAGVQTVVGGAARSPHHGGESPRPGWRRIDDGPLPHDGVRADGRAWRAGSVGPRRAGCTPSPPPAGRGAPR